MYKTDMKTDYDFQIMITKVEKELGKDILGAWD